MALFLKPIMLSSVTVGLKDWTRTMAFCLVYRRVAIAIKLHHWWTWQDYDVLPI